jgi:hypothetical protein
MTEENKTPIFSPEQLKEINSIFTSRLDPVKQTIETMRQSGETNHQAILEALKGSKETKKAPTDDEEKLTLKQQVAELQEYRKGNETKEREERITTQIKQALASNGINQRADLLLPVIRKDIELNKQTGQLEMKFGGLTRPLSEGLQMFAETDTGMFYRDPTNLSGTGATDTSNNQSNSNPAKSAVLRDPTKATAKNFLNLEQMTQLIKDNTSSGLKF